MKIIITLTISTEVLEEEGYTVEQLKREYEAAKVEMMDGAPEGAEVTLEILP